MLHAAWFPPMQDGVRLAGGELAPEDLECVAYGRVFRPLGRSLALGVPPLTAVDVQSGFDEQLLAAWWAEAARVDSAVIAPDARTLISVSNGVQAALRALSGSRFFAGLTMRMLIFSLHQVRRYLTDPAVHAAIQECVASIIREDTRVVVGHSLGSVVAYEALSAHPEWPVRTLVTLGSPLGIRNLIFDRLQPTPIIDGRRVRGVWPPSVRTWTNVVDAGDVVALVKDLRPLFGNGVHGFVIENFATAHDVSSYLTDKVTGAAILTGLGG
jgi:pimeloyl-ACP methyl ester carboxylesterase